MSRNLWIPISSGFALLIAGLAIGWTLHSSGADSTTVPIATSTTLHAPPAIELDPSIFAPCLCDPCAGDVTTTDLVKINSPTTAVRLPGVVASMGTYEGVVEPPRGPSAVSSQPYSGVRNVDGSMILEFPLVSINEHGMRVDLSLLHNDKIFQMGPYGASMALSIDAIILKDDTDLQFIAGAYERFDATHVDTQGQVQSYDLFVGYDLVADVGAGEIVGQRVDGTVHKYWPFGTDSNGNDVYRIVEIKSPDGNLVEIVRDGGSGLITAIVTPTEGVYEFEYENYTSSPPHSFLRWITDPLGRRWEFTYTQSSPFRLLEIAYPETQVVSDYDGAGLPDTDELGTSLNGMTSTSPTTELLYHPSGSHRISKITDPRGNVTQKFIYDSATPTPRVEEIKILSDGTKNSILFEYDNVDLPSDVEGDDQNGYRLESGNLTRKITDRMGNVTYLEIHGMGGGPDGQGGTSGDGKYQLRRIIRKNGTGYVERRFLQDCDCGQPAVISAWFDSDNHGSTDSFGIPTSWPRTEFEYNALKQVTRVTRHDGQGNEFVTKAAYQLADPDQDEFARLLWIIGPRGSDPFYGSVEETPPSDWGGNNESAALEEQEWAFATRFLYDSVGRMVKRERRVSLGQATPLTLEEEWTYISGTEANGLLETYTDPLGNVTRFSYYISSEVTFDSVAGSVAGAISQQGMFPGRLRSVTASDGDLDLTTTFKSNALGAITYIEPPLGSDFSQTVKYTNVGWLMQVDLPDTPHTGSGSFSNSIDYFYDENGNRVATRRENRDFEGTLIGSAGYVFSAAKYNERNLPTITASQVSEGSFLHHETVYNKNDQIAIRVQPEENRTFVLYDSLSRQHEVYIGVAPGGPSDHPDIGGFGMSASFISKVTTTYDARGNRIAVEDGRSNVRTYFYDGFDRLLATRDPNGNGARVDFGSTPVTVDPRAIEYGEVGMNGNMLDVLARSYERYDELGRSISAALDSDVVSSHAAVFDLTTIAGSNPVSLSIYDAGGRLIEAVDPNGSSTHYDYDSASRTIEVTDEQGNTVEYLYDDNSRVARVIVTEVPEIGGGGTNELREVTYAYDRLGRVTSIESLGLGGLTGHVTTFDFDSLGRMQRATDAEGRFAITTFDDVGRMLKLERFDSSTNRVYLQEAEWDENGRKVADLAYTDAATPGAPQVTRYGYDRANRMTIIVMPDSDDEITYVAGDAVGDNGSDTIYNRTEVVFDENGNPIETTDPNGTVFLNTYDAGNRHTFQDQNLGSGVVGGTWKAFQYDALNRLEIAENWVSKTTRTYDDLSRLATEAQELSGFTGSEVVFSYQHDLASNRTAMEVNSASGTDLSVTYEHDVLHRLKAMKNLSVLDGELHIDDPLAIEYFGHRRFRKMLNLDGQGVPLATLHYAFDSKGRISDMDWKDTINGPLVAGFGYAYDKVDVPLWEQWKHDENRYDHLSHDALDQLVGVTYRHHVSTPPSAENTYVYDSNFNRAGDQQTDGMDARDPFELWARQQAVYAVADDNKYTNISNFGAPQHDQNGNLTYGPTVPGHGAFTVAEMELEWTALNQLHRVEVDDGNVIEHEEYRYDALGRRVMTTTSANTLPIVLSSSSKTIDVNVADAIEHHAWDGWRNTQDRLISASTASVSVAEYHNDTWIGTDVYQIDAVLVSLPYSFDPVTQRFDIGDGWTVTVEPVYADIQSQFHKLYVHAEGIDELLLYVWDQDLDGELTTNLNRSADAQDFGDTVAFYLENRLGNVIALVDYRHLEGAYEVYEADTPGPDKSVAYLGSSTTENRRARVLTYAKYDVYGNATWMGVVDGAFGGEDGFEDSPFSLRDNADLGETSRADFIFDQKFGWHGKEARISMNMLYSRHRWFSPTTGRFISRDPLRYIDGPNDRQFVRNRVQSLIDARGLSAATPDPELEPQGLRLGNLGPQVEREGYRNRYRAAAPADWYGPQGTTYSPPGTETLRLDFGEFGEVEIPIPGAFKRWAPLRIPGSGVLHVIYYEGGRSTTFRHSISPPGSFRDGECRVYFRTWTEVEWLRGGELKSYSVWNLEVFFTLGADRRIQQGWIPLNYRAYRFEARMRVFMNRNRRVSQFRRVCPCEEDEIWRVPGQWTRWRIAATEPDEYFDGAEVIRERSLE